MVTPDVEIHWWGDEALRHRMGEAARRRIAERYSVAQMVEQYAALYEQVLKRKKSNRRPVGRSLGGV